MQIINKGNMMRLVIYRMSDFDCIDSNTIYMIQFIGAIKYTCQVETHNF